MAVDGVLKERGVVNQRGPCVLSWGWRDVCRPLVDERVLDRSLAR